MCFQLPRETFCLKECWPIQWVMMMASEIMKEVSKALILLRLNRARHEILLQTSTHKKLRSQRPRMIQQQQLMKTTFDRRLKAKKAVVILSTNLSLSILPSKGPGCYRRLWASLALMNQEFQAEVVKDHQFSWDKFKSPLIGSSLIQAESVAMKDRQNSKPAPLSSNISSTNCSKASFQTSRNPNKGYSPPTFSVSWKRAWQNCKIKLKPCLTNWKRKNLSLGLKTGNSIQTPRKLSICQPS